MLRRFLHAALFGTLLLAVTAEGVEVRYQADPARVAFTHQRQAFGAWGFDTGWRPASSPLQVRFWGDVGGGFSAYAPGVARLGWHPTRALWLEGEHQGGWLDMNVGVEFHARIRLDLQVPAGPHYTWEGDIPYVPNFDFRFSRRGSFTPFLLEGSAPDHVRVADTIQPTQLVSVPLTQALIPIPGIGGNLTVSAGGELSASLWGERMVLTEGELPDVSSFITWWVPVEPAYLTRARYEALMQYQGTLQVIPALKVNVGPQSWTLASFTFPVPLARIDDPWVFNEQDAAFDLPRLRVVSVDGAPVEVSPERHLAVDFGEGSLGSATERTLVVENSGRAWLVGDLLLEGQGFQLVAPSSASLLLEPGKQTTVVVSLTRPGDGTFAGALKLDTSDPAGRVTVALTGLSRAEGSGGGDGPLVGNGDGDGDSSEGEGEDDRLDIIDPSGCGCGAGGGALPLLGGALLVWATSRRRRAA